MDMMTDIGKGSKEGMMSMINFDNPETMQGLMKMMGGFTVLRLSSMMGMANINFTKEELLKMNKQRNRIRKPKNKKK